MVRGLALFAAWTGSVAHAGDAFECTRYAGVAVGAVELDTSWEFLGRGPVAPTVSPMLGLACLVQPAKTSFFVGGETAPTYAHVGFDGTLRAHWWTVTAGVDRRIGDHSFGPIASAGFTGIGGGLRGLWRTHEDKKGRRRGVETRVLGYHGAGFDVQVAVLYTLGVETF